MTKKEKSQQSKEPPKYIRVLKMKYLQGIPSTSLNFLFAVHLLI